MVKYTTLSHCGEIWTLISITEDCGELRRSPIATFDAAGTAIASNDYISTPLPALYQTVYSADYHGHTIHVTQRSITEKLDGCCAVRTMYIGLVIVNDTPIYMDYMKPANDESGVVRGLPDAPLQTGAGRLLCSGLRWRSLADAVSNIKWFVKTQLTDPECTSSKLN